MCGTRCLGLDAGGDSGTGQPHGDAWLVPTCGAWDWMSGLANHTVMCVWSPPARPHPGKVGGAWRRNGAPFKTHRSLKTSCAPAQPIYFCY